MANDPKTISERLIALIQDLGGTLTVEEALHVVIEHMKTFPHQSLAGLVRDDLTGDLTIKISRQISHGFVKQFRRPLGGTAIPRVILQHERVILNDLSPQDPEYAALRLEHDFRHACLVPIIQNQRAVGYLHCDRRDEPPFTEEDARRLLIYAYLVGMQMRRFELLFLTRHLAQVDEASQALKYSAFLEQFHREVERARTYRTPLCLVLLKLDEYSRFAATAGIAAGHALLAALHARLKQCLRPMDIIGRFSADEFIVCLGGMGRAEADATLACIRDTIHGLRDEQTYGAVSACAVAMPIEGAALDLPLETIHAALGGGLLAARTRGRDQYALIAPPTA